MEILGYILSETVLILLSAMMMLLFIRAVMSFVAPDSDHPLVNFVFNVTDIILAPARFFVDKTGFLADSMFDIAYFITVVALWLLEALFIFLS